MTDTSQGKHVRARFDKTVRSSFKLVLEAASIKELLLSNLGLIASVLGTIVVIFEKNFFNEAARLITGGSAFSYPHALQWLFIWLGIVLISQIFIFISTQANDRLWIKIQYYIQEKLMIKISRIRVDYFARTETYQQFEWVKNELNQKLPGILNATFGLILYSVQLVTALFILSIDHWVIACLVLLGCIPSIIIKKRHTEANYNYEQNNSHELRYQTYVSWVMFKRPYMKEMRYGNLYDYVNQRFDDSVTELYKQRIHIIRKYSLFNGTARLVNLITIGAALVLISFDIYHGRAGIGSFVLVFSTARVMQNAFQALFDNVVLIGSDGRFISDYEDIMCFDEYSNEQVSAEMLVKGDYVPERTTHPNVPAEIDIEFRNVDFTYAETNREILKNVSVTIRQGEKIAIVGENGSGKSTFISLLCGMHKPDNGSVLINELDAYQQQKLIKRTVSCTFQMFGHYAMSVADNIRIGDIHHAYSEDEIREAAELAGAYDFICKLPNGLHTQLSNYKLGGVELSGGEWQKIAIARAILKRDARVLVLDEPTAALDPVAEAKLYEDFHRITGNKTTILISHRLGATRLADRILVFDHGRIVEEGSHTELMARQGLYAEMYKSQSQWYVA